MFVCASVVFFVGFVCDILVIAQLTTRQQQHITGCEVYGKAEFQNPSGSVKDRAALSIIREAEEQGILTPGKPGLIVEGTAGKHNSRLIETKGGRLQACTS